MSEHGKQSIDCEGITLGLLKNWSMTEIQTTLLHVNYYRAQGQKSHTNLDVPAKRSKLLAFQNDGMEETDSEDDTTPVRPQRWTEIIKVKENARKFKVLKQRAESQLVGWSVFNVQPTPWGRINSTRTVLKKKKTRTFIGHTSHDGPNLRKHIIGRRKNETTSHHCLRKRRGVISAKALMRIR